MFCAALLTAPFNNLTTVDDSATVFTFYYPVILNKPIHCALYIIPLVDMNVIVGLYQGKGVNYNLQLLPAYAIIICTNITKIKY